MDFKNFTDMELLTRYGELYRKHKPSKTEKYQKLLIQVANEIIKRMKNKE